jgi:hypothetical protein
MISLFKQFALILFSTGCFIVSSSIAVAEDLRDLRPGVVKILSFNKLEGQLRTGTGFIVKLEEQATYIATAAHVVEGDAIPQVAFFPQANRFYPGQILGTEGHKDDGVAVLVVPGVVPEGLRSLVVSTASNISEGEETAVIGFPVEANTPWVISKGIIAGRRGADITFTGFVGEGNSGGPLLLHEQVLGIVTEMRGQLGYAVPMVTAQIALEGWGVTSEQTAYETQMAKPANGELEKVKAELEDLRHREEQRAAELEALKKREQARILQQMQRQRQHSNDAIREQIRVLEKEYTAAGASQGQPADIDKQYEIKIRISELTSKLKRVNDVPQIFFYPEPPALPAP